MLEGQKVVSIFVKVRSKGMAKGMACEAMFPAELIFGFSHMPLYDLRAIWLIRIMLAREKIIARSSASAPVLLKFGKSDRG